MKKTFLLFFGSILCFMLQAETTTATSYAGGTGTETDPYQIETLAQLRLLSETSDDWLRSFILTANIDASDTKTWNYGMGFSPIGNSQRMFAGNFDGNSYVIDSLSINMLENESIGLFGVVEDATIKNLGLANCTVTTRDNQAGALIGYALQNSIVEHCFVSGEIISGTGVVGGLIGVISSTTLIKQCYTNCTIQGGTYTGGLVGQMRNTSKIEDCFVFGNTTSNNNCGGIVGYLYGGTIKKCYVSGKVFDEGSGKGAIVGSVYSPAYYYLISCYYDKTINPTVGSMDGDANTNVTALSSSDFASKSNFALDFTNTWKIYTNPDFDDVARPYLQWMYNYIVTFNVGTNGDSMQGYRKQYISEGKSTKEVTAIGKAGYILKEWQDALGNALSTDNPLIITNVTQDSTLTAIFQAGFNVNFNADEYGTVTGDTSQGVVSGADASAVSAVASAGYQFNEWRNVGGDSISNINPLTITNVTQDSTLIAVFEKKQYTIKFSTKGNGTISGNAEQTVVHGAGTSAVTANPSNNNTFINWQDTNGKTISTENTLTLTSIVSDSTIYAVFEIKTGIEANNVNLNLTIAPNPTNGLVTIPLESEVANLTVYSLSGKQVYNTPAFEGGSVDFSNLQNGLYVVKLSSEGKISMAKLIKK